MRPRLNPVGDQPAAGDARQVVEILEQAEPRQRLHDAEIEGGAADAATRQAQTREPLRLALVAELLVDRFQGRRRLAAVNPPEMAQLLPQDLVELERPCRRVRVSRRDLAARGVRLVAAHRGGRAGDDPGGACVPPRAWAPSRSVKTFPARPTSLPGAPV